MTTQRELAKGFKDWLTPIVDPWAVIIASDIHGPDTRILLTPYKVPSDTENGNEVTGIQLRYRAAEREGVGIVWDMSDMIFNRMQHRRMTLSNGVKIILAWQESSINLGQDDKNRFEVSDNYYVRTDREITI